MRIGCKASTAAQTTRHVAIRREGFVSVTKRVEINWDSSWADHTKQPRVVAAELLVSVKRKPLNLVPYFKFEELVAAFQLVVSDQEADRRAREFFDGATLDDSGYLLWEPWGYPLPEEMQSEYQELGLIVSYGPIYVAEENTGGFEVYRNKSDTEKGELLRSFTDFTLSLVSLVSEELAARIQHLRGYSDAQTQRGLSQMRVILGSVGRGT